MILMDSPGLTQSGTCLPAEGQLLQGPGTDTRQLR